MGWVGGGGRAGGTSPVVFPQGFRAGDGGPVAISLTVGVATLVGGGGGRPWDAALRAAGRPLTARSLVVGKRWQARSRPPLRQAPFGARPGMGQARTDEGPAQGRRYGLAFPMVRGLMLALMGAPEVARRRFFEEGDGVLIFIAESGEVQVGLDTV